MSEQVKVNQVEQGAVIAEQSATSQLKRVLGRKELMSVAIGQIIGAGIMAMTGAAIAMTGKSVSVAFLISSLFVVILCIPSIFVGGTIRMRGGQYTMAALFGGKRFAGIYMVIYIFANVSIAMYAISFADYLLALIPGLNSTLIAVVVLTGFYLTNLFGMKGAAKLQNLMILVLCAALLAFIGFGLPDIQPGYFSGVDFMPAGLGGLFGAAAFLTFATGGATVVINLSAEAKNPTKDIPFVLIVSTVAVAGVYALMSSVASGVLPVEQVANKPLNLVAFEIMPTPVYIFFIVGGALFALSTTLNATLGWVTKPLLQASVDGWFPKHLGVISKKHKVPYVLLTIFYIVGLIPILTGWDISFIAQFSLILNLGIFIVLNLATMRLPKLFPKLWENSKFKVSNKILNILCIFAAAVAGLQCLLLATSLTKIQLIGNLAIFVLAIVYATIREKSGKVNMEISYEEE